jgi:hypothetical protein
MSHTAVSQLFGDDGSFVGGGAHATVGPVSVQGQVGVGDAIMHLHLLGVVALLVILWGVVRIAGFRFVVTTGVGR